MVSKEPEQGETVRDFEGIVFEDKTFIYDGKFHKIEVQNVPSGATVKYVNNNKREIGTYKVKASISMTGYNSLELSATLNIIPQPSPIDVYEDKVPFALDSKTTFDGLMENIYKGNFTLETKSGTRLLYHQQYEHAQYYEKVDNVYSVTSFGADIDHCYEKIDYSNDEYGDHEIFTQVVGENAYSSTLKNKTIKDEDIKKIPSTYFDETFIKSKSSVIFDHLQRTSENGFKELLYENYYVYFSRYSIENNKFTVEYYNRILHDEADYNGKFHDTEEYDILTFYNIGNTKVNIPENFIGKEEKANIYEPGSFVCNGISYNFADDTYSSNLTITPGELTYLEKGEINLLVEIYDTYVSSVGLDTYSYKDGAHMGDCSGITLNVEFNKDGYYGLKYKKYGKILSGIPNTSLNIVLNRFEIYGAVIAYHERDVDDIGFFQNRTDGSIEGLDCYNVTVINTDYYTKEQIEKIKKTKTKVLGYLNIGVLERSSSYFSEFESITFKDYNGSSDARWIDVKNYTWKNYVLNTLIPEIYKKGVDGIYLEGTRVYLERLNDEESTYDMLYGTRQAISDFMSKVQYSGLLMLQACDELMYDISFYDGTKKYAPYYVDYYVQEEVITKINDDKTFSLQDSSVTNNYKEALDFDIERYGLEIVLLEYATDNVTKKMITDYCEANSYHCYISNSIKLD